MRQAIMIIVSLALFLSPGIRASCQEDLHCGWVFEQGSRVDGHKLETSLVKGDKLSSYNLSLFHSIKLCCTPKEYHEISEAVLADSNGALDKEIEISSGDITYALLRLEAKNGVNRYLAMQRTSHSTFVKDETTVTDAFILVYMEGKATIPELRAIFSKKNI